MALTAVGQRVEARSSIGTIYRRDSSQAGFAEGMVSPAHSKWYN